METKAEYRAENKVMADIGPLLRYLDNLNNELCDESIFYHRQHSSAWSNGEYELASSSANSLKELQRLSNYLRDISSLLNKGYRP